MKVAGTGQWKNKAVEEIDAKTGKVVQVFKNVKAAADDASVPVENSLALEAAPLQELTGAPLPPATVGPVPLPKSEKNKILPEN